MASDSEYRAKLLDLARQARTPILLGLPRCVSGSTRIDSFNRAYLVSADGSIVDYYDKMELAPFAEYVPARKLFGFFVHKVVVGLGEFVPGQRQTLFDVKGAKLAVLICYEGIFPALSRTAVDNGADVLVNITNDAWYGNSSAPYQLLAMSALRSVETHTPMVRVANTGISAVIMPDGRITARTDLIYPRHRNPDGPLAAWPHVLRVAGDLFAELCFALSIIGLLAALAFARRRPEKTRISPAVISPNGHR